MTNPLRVWGSLALCVPLALLGACASADKPKPVVVRSVIQAPGKAHVTVSNASDGASVVLDATQELHVNLALSGWEVANNMDWSVTDLKPGVLTALGSRFDRSARDVNPLESEGSAVWRFKAQAPGQIRLTFGLRRPYSVGPPLKSVSFDVTVK
ncbi:MAG: protease inhibitor I42 family protein [Pseudomonadota bacterium]